MNSNNTLSGFLSAQQNIHLQVLKELESGKKTSHWMWFIFPQIEGLGQSSTAKYYSIKSIDETKQYLAHPILGKRLLECSSILLNINGKTVEEILGYPDNLKLKSSMTLFHFVAPEQKVFGDVLNKYFGGEKDQITIDIIMKMKTDANQ